MANEHLAAYLNDHLAGSVAAVELLEDLEKAHAGTAAEIAPVLKGVDYERLAQRARDQRHRLEGVRLQAAKSAFGAVP
jgi:hypothetical protein